MLRSIRGFFDTLGVLEVETPLLSHHFGTDPSIQPLTSEFVGPGYSSGLPLFLQSSPEFAMKRLLAAGSGPIFQVCKAFRNGEFGRLHNPEFTILEWYRPGFELSQLMAEVADLACLLLDKRLEVERVAYRDLFEQYLGIDPCTIPVDELHEIAIRQIGAGVPELDSDDRDGWLDLLMTHTLEPLLGKQKLTFIYNYPASQASLAQLDPIDPLVAQRFELYYRGVELANGFHELADEQQQRARFNAENQVRAKNGDPMMALDERLLAALAEGLPDCAGVALGLDRLLMLLGKADALSEVISFPLPEA